MGSGVLALHEITDWNLEAIEVNRPTLFPVRMCKLLKARVAAQRIEHWIEPEQRWSERHVFSQRPAPGIESSFCKAAMARSGSPPPAAIRARISIGREPETASFSIGTVDVAFSARAKAADLSPRPILVNARSPMRTEFSGCSLRKDSSSVRAWRQLSWAAAWSPATSCAQPK